MIRKLAHLAFTTRSAPLVLMLDQVERSGDAEQAMVTFQRAIDALLGIESQVGSAVVVIGCLSNLYDKALKVMGRSTLDRLVTDPPPARLRDQLSYEEVQAIIGHRLAWMFAEKGAVYRASEPVYPIPEAQLRNRIGHRPRDVLEWCQQFQERCVTAKQIIEVDDADADAQFQVVSLPPIPPLPQRPSPLQSSQHSQQLQHRASPQTGLSQTALKPQQPRPPEPLPPIDRISSAWNDTLEGSRVKVLDDDDVLALVEAAAHAYAEETGVSLTLAYKGSFLRLTHSSGGQQVDFVIGVTNRGPQAGAFGTQIKKLRQAARGAIAIAVRTDEFPTGAKSVELVEDLRGAGGRAICLDKQTLRALLAHQSFQPAFSVEHVQAWRHSKRPIASLRSIVEIFGLDLPGAEATSRGWPSGTAPPASSAAAG